MPFAVLVTDAGFRLGFDTLTPPHKGFASPHTAAQAFAIFTG
jgi:hypothetical protein